jgi:hypothetical protein
VRPDLYNEVFEGKITYTGTGLNLPPGEANNRMASGATLQVEVPQLQVASPLATTLSPGEARLYKVSVAAGETLRVDLDATATEGSNELYIRYGDIPTGYAFDASYSNPVATDQQAVIGSTLAGDYYILVRAREGASNSPVTLRADLLPLSITKITPDQGGTGDDDHRWVTLDIYGSHFKAGALVKLARPGVYEAEPERWQVLDATHIRAIFDMRKLPLGLYDGTFGFPIIVKPRKGYGSKRLWLVEDEVDLAYVRKRDEGLLIAQECIGSGDEEYTTGVFSDGSRVSSITFRRRLGFGGLSAEAEYSERPFLDALSERVATATNLRGSINIQSRRMGDDLFIPFEINPRLSSTLSLRKHFGFDDAVWWLEALRGKGHRYERKFRAGKMVRFVSDYYFDMEDAATDDR